MSHLAIAVAPADHAPASLYLYTPCIDRFLPILATPPPSGPTLKALARSDRYLYIATTPYTHRGEAEPSLLVYRSEDGLYEGRYRLGGVVDLTGIQVSDGLLRVVSSGTGEMVAFRREGAIIGPDRFTWAPTFDPDIPSTALRLQSIAEHRLEVWMTALGPVGHPAPSGFAFNLTRATIITRHLDHPNALVGDDQSLWLLEIGPARLRTLDATLSLDLPAGARGLALLNDTLYTATDTHLLAIDPVALTSGPVATLPGPATDLIALEDAGNWPDEPDIDWPHTHGLLLDATDTNTSW